MIARNVHAHTPQEQLKYDCFKQFSVPVEEAMKIDETEIRKNGLNIDLIKREYV
jgi:hypothetical protein